MLQGGQPINDRLSRPKNSITCVNKPAPRPPTLYQKTMPNMASSCTSIKKRCLERQRPPTPYLVPKRPALSHTGQGLPAPTVHNHLRTSYFKTFIYTEGISWALFTELGSNFEKRPSTNFLGLEHFSWASTLTSLRLNLWLLSR